MNSHKYWHTKEDLKNIEVWNNQYVDIKIPPKNILGAHIVLKGFPVDYSLKESNQEDVEALESSFDSFFHAVKVAGKMSDKARSKEILDDYVKSLKKFAEEFEGTNKAFDAALHASTKSPTMWAKNLQKAFKSMEKLEEAGTHPGSIETDENNEKNYVKFPAKHLYDNVNQANLHSLTEYLAYKILALYPSIRTPPRVSLAFNQRDGSIGIRSGLVPGDWPTQNREKELIRKVGSTYFVHALIANWDVKPKNMIHSTADDNVYMIDPGGALTFRSMGKRKGNAFSDHANEVNTFRDPKHVAGRLFQHMTHDDMKQAAKDFSNVPWSQIDRVIRIAEREVSSKLKAYGFVQMADIWKEEISLIRHKLRLRHKHIMDYIAGNLSEAKVMMLRILEGLDPHEAAQSLFI